MTTITTMTGNTVELSGLIASVKSMSFQVQKHAGGLISHYFVDGRRIEIKLDAANLKIAHDHIDTEGRKIAAQHKIDYAHDYMADRIHAGNGDADASR